MHTKTGWAYLLHLHEACRFTSREKGGICSNSELKRWCEQSVLRINGQVIKWNEHIPFPDEIESVTLFSKRNKITLV